MCDMTGFEISASQGQSPADTCGVLEQVTDSANRGKCGFFLFFFRFNFVDGRVNNNDNDGNDDGDDDNKMMKHTVL